MIVENKLPSRMTLDFEKGSFSMTNIKQTATPVQIYNLARGINAIQDTTAKKIRMIEVKKIMSV